MAIRKLDSTKRAGILLGPTSLAGLTAVCFGLFSLASAALAQPTARASSSGTDGAHGNDTVAAGDAGAGSSAAGAADARPGSSAKLGHKSRQKSQTKHKSTQKAQAKRKSRQKSTHRAGRKTSAALTALVPIPSASYQTVVVSALRPETNLESPRSVDLVTRSRMDQLSSQSTPGLLSQVPGVLVQKTNHGGGSAFIGGMTGQHVLYLIDGVRLNNSTTRYGPNQLLNTVDEFSLARVEVLRGPGSILYGSDALGGVISLVSRRPSFVPGSLWRWGGTAVGRFDSSDLSQSYDAAVWGQYRRVSALVGGSFKDFGSLVGGRGIGLQKWTGYSEGDWDGAVRIWLGGRWFLKMATNSVRQTDVPRTDKCSDTDYRYYRHQFRDVVYAKVTGGAGKALDQFDLTVSFQNQREFRQRYRIDRDRLENEFDQVGTAGLGLVAVTDLGRYSKLTYGMDVYYDWVHSTANRQALSTGAVTPMDGASFRGRFVDGSQYLQGGVLLTDELRPWHWFIVRLGGRIAVAHASIPTDPLAAQYGLAASPIRATFWGPVGGVNLEFVPWNPLRLIASVQQGFRAPNLDDYSHLGSEGGGFDVPSPDLHKAERTTTLEVGVKLGLPRVQTWLFAHYSFLRGFISRAYTGDEVDGEPATVRVNASSGFLAGVDAYGRVVLGRGFDLGAWMSWTRGDLSGLLGNSGTQPMRRIPPLQGLVRVGYHSRDGRWWAAAMVRWAKRQDRLAPGDFNDKRICPNGPDNCAGTPGFGVVSLAGGVQLNRFVDLTLRVENLGNTPYKYHGSGVYGPGLSAIAQIRVRK